jgi:predicted lipoprotein with Yx(FWY)xxD motif
MLKIVLAASALTVALSGAAFAQSMAMPTGVKMANGAMADAAGKPLYTYDNDTMKGMSHCEGRCAAAWPPLPAADDAKPVAGWSIISRGDGSKQWAYHDKPLYTFAKDTAGEPGTGETVPNWKLAK